MSTCVRRLLCACLLAATLAAGQAPDSDVVLRALGDEVMRTLELSLPGLDKPYYSEFGLHDVDSFSVSAVLGGVLWQRRNRVRIPSIQVRVGSYEFDNTNYLLSDLGFGTMDVGRPSLENSYPALRHFFWLAADAAYKSSLQALARKRAALRNVTVAEQTPDFWRADPVRVRLEAPRTPIDAAAWTKVVAHLSSLFAGFPDLTRSGVHLEIVQSDYYFVNTEGTACRIPERLAQLRLSGAALASDGMTVRDATVFLAREPDGLPPLSELERAVRDLGERVQELARAPWGEPYLGPVLFEGAAAAQLFAEVLGRNLVARRRPVGEPGRPVPFQASEFEGRIGSRVLPEWMEVVDDPTQKEWRGRPLLGFYPVDLEGQVPKPVVLIERGVLRNLLLTRQPVAGFSASNGRARLPGAFGAKTAWFGNLFVRATETVPAAELRQRLLAQCRARNLPYGLLVRKMDYPSSASAEEARRLLTRLAQAGDGGRAISLPLLVYRLYPDGREELVRGLRFRAFSARTLRDILAASEEVFLFEYLENGAPFALSGAGSFVAESAVVAPSVLFEELQLERAEEQLPNPPVVPPPSLSLRR
ncbi:MAG: metallopeptidase TldD-related protein [Bryobacterales bacterium]|nr:metallopeptidase TldD-related protein [Bryobacteraceae bacterium]MDW8353052.1 metallopeptidase TldD-related protein [Bryobacterales bacterium]